MGTVHISPNSCWIAVYHHKQSNKLARFEQPRMRRNCVQRQWPVWFSMMPYIKQTNMNSDKALESRILPIQWRCYLFVYSLFFKYQYSHLFFHFVGSEEKVSRAKRKLVSSCLGIIYLMPGISNPVGAKLFLCHLGINFFGANWYLRRNCTQRGHCLAGAKLSCWYFGIISSWRQLGSI